MAKGQHSHTGLIKIRISSGADRTSGDQLLYHILRIHGLPMKSKVRGRRLHERGTEYYHIFKSGIL